MTTPIKPPGPRPPADSVTREADAAKNAAPASEVKASFREVVASQKPSAPTATEATVPASSSVSVEQAKAHALDRALQTDLARALPPELQEDLKTFLKQALESDPYLDELANKAGSSK